MVMEAVLFIAFVVAGGDESLRVTTNRLILGLSQRPAMK
jgi:hypothetical protein